MTEEPKTPWHDKAKEHADEMQSIGEFIEWLPTTKLHIAKYIDGEEGYGLYPIPMGQLTINMLLAEFFGIDYDAYQEEKEAVYQYVSALANQHESHKNQT
jgi:hypothetical protein